MYKIYKISNVLSNKERKKLIKDVQPLLLDSKQLNGYFKDPHASLDGQEITPYNYPGKQTHPLLHLKPEFASVTEKMLDKINKEIKVDLQVYQSWVKWSNGRENQMNWHDHLRLNQGISFAVVYYIKTIPFFSSGTLFEDGFVRVPQNSMIIFPAHILHTTPKHPFPFIDRYVMSMDLTFRNLE